ncbi:MAG: GDP-mannose 4,6-dehydratase [Chlamydiales bacterium]|nr:GDP-mannose 4,6-dehydratase [Chlamydiales bacterium]
MKRVFITGIAGFIGFHLALFLKERGDFVTGCDNFNAYYDPALKHARVELLKEKGISVLECDICNTSKIEEIVKNEEITHFVHLAAQAGVRHSLFHPESYVHSNLDGFVKIIELVRCYPSMKFIYASSSSVYGHNEKIPFAETDPCERPANLYGATKKTNELVAYSYHHLYGLSVTGLRFFTVYGPWGRPDMATFSFTRAILNGETIQVYNHGKMKRDFTYIDDIVKGTAAAIDLGAPCEIFNLGNNHPEELLSLISIIEKETKKPAKVHLLPMQPGEVLTTYADISKSQKMLGFAPSISLAEGMSRFIAWYKTYYESAT